MNMNGINGERASAIEDVLALADKPLRAIEITDEMRRMGHEDILPRSGKDETVASVLKHMYEHGIVTRHRRTLRHGWTYVWVLVRA